MKKILLLCPLLMGFSSGPNFPGTGTDDSSIGTNAWLSPGSVTAHDGVNADAAFATACTFQDFSVKLIKGGVVSGSEHADTATNWPAVETTASYGSATDLWSLVLTPTDINAANFGAALSAHTPNGGGSGVNSHYLDGTNPHFSTSGIILGVKLDVNRAATTSGSFPAGIGIASPNGPLDIKDLKPGDVIYGFNGVGIETVTVTDHWSHPQTTFLTLTTDFRRVTSTPDHPFALPDGTYTQGRNLQVGDMIVVRDSDTVSEEAITSTRIFTDSATVYDISVNSPEHNFFANGFLVHNMGRRPGGCVPKDWYLPKPLPFGLPRNLLGGSTGVSGGCISSGDTLVDDFQFTVTYLTGCGGQMMGMTCKRTQVRHATTWSYD